MLIHGRCHCGNIHYELAWNPDPAEIPARACDCTFCTKHGGVWTSSPQASLTVRIKDPAAVSVYEFGTRTAQFQVCARCGVVPVVTSRIEGRLYAVVSVNAMQDIDRSMIRPANASFGAEDVATRLARRTRNWIGDVRVVTA